MIAVSGTRLIFVAASPTRHPTAAATATATAMAV
jgi:hypothetical protein